MPLKQRLQEIWTQNFRGHVGWALSLFFIGLGAKFMLVLKSHSPLPYLDQWDAEAINTYLPYFNHTLSVAKLFEPHNEHRIVFTKLYDLALLLLNGEWDSELQMTVNALFHCGALASFGWLMARILGARNWPFIWLPLAAALVLPFGWENTLCGFQSVFYFLILFGLLTLWLLGMSEPWSGRWVLGVVAGVAGLFTMASGFMAAAAVAAICIFDTVKESRSWRRQLPTVLVCVGIIAAGLLLKADVPRHHALQAQSILALQKSLGKNLAWPSSSWAWVAPLNLLPLILLAWMYGRGRTRPPVAERMVLATGLWGVLQALAAAYARGGADGDGPASRYMDMESFIMIASCLSIVLLVRDYREHLGWRPFWYACFVIWGLSCIGGLWFLTQSEDGPAIAAWNARQEKREANTRAFMVTDDPHVFDHKYNEDLPYPQVPVLVSLLRDENIRRILPSVVREPMPARSETKSSVSKEPGETMGRLSFWARQALRAWKGIIAAGVLCLFLSLIGYLRMKSNPAKALGLQNEMRPDN